MGSVGYKAPVQGVSGFPSQATVLIFSLKKTLVLKVHSRKPAWNFPNCKVTSQNQAKRKQTLPIPVAKHLPDGCLYSGKLRQGTASQPHPWKSGLGVDIGFLAARRRLPAPLTGPSPGSSITHVNTRVCGMGSEHLEGAARLAEKPALSSSLPRAGLLTAPSLFGGS